MLSWAGGVAGSGRQEMPMQEQRSLFCACQSAVAQQQHAEVIRLLRSQHLGLQISDEKLAWRLLKVSRS